ncbi:SDR family NAD(P)-dependent oxidoreductase [Actinomadura rugatobispora]|uniref:SDR family NAD(P)-dependent oxidoreductase n=1 Tax=Actinomadura rugatobispora TaxID=1994 RepID=A0ABW1A4K5_9ACTN|nr:SDR family oxidoreductase [Actinomadura rugatobispora]
MGTGERPVAVVTGANRGIGYAVAERLVREGHEVVLVSRDRDRGETARASLDASGQGEGRVRLVVGDLSSIRAIRETAVALTAACPRIDVLVHNAGMWPYERVLNEDGLEQSYVTNHLAPFLLNLELEPLLLASNARVVQVSAGLYVKGVAHPDRTPEGLHFHPLRTYADTKLCNLMMVPLFAERWKGTGVTIDAVHPGVIRTGLGDRTGPLGAVLKASKVLWKKPAKGARPVVALALATDGGTGRYFHLEKEQPLAPVAADRDLAQRLWDRTARTCDVS